MKLNNIYTRIGELPRRYDASITNNGAVQPTMLGSADFSQPENLHRRVAHSSNVGTTYTMPTEAIDDDGFEDSTRIFEADLSDFWMQGDIDIFANLGGLDAGLSSILTA